MLNINGKEIEENFFKNKTLEANSYSELAKLIGFKYINGKLIEIFQKNAINLAINFEHFNKKLYLQNRIKYPFIIKQCPLCNSDFETQQGHPNEKKACSYKCANVYFAQKKTEESKLKIKTALLKYYGKDLYKKCLRCSKEYFNCKNKYCSKECANLSKVKNPITGAKISAALKRCISEGRHKGWKSRNKLLPSFAEQVTMKILQELNLEYEFELPTGKWFIDFAFVDQKIALEVDGAQHKFPERQESDKNKDTYLTDNGWTIHRIPWKKFNQDFLNEVIEHIKVIFDKSDEVFLNASELANQIKKKEINE